MLNAECSLYFFPRIFKIVPSLSFFPVIYNPRCSPLVLESNTFSFFLGCVSGGAFRELRVHPGASCSSL